MLQKAMQGVVAGEKDGGVHAVEWHLLKGAECLLSNSMPVAAMCVLGQCWARIKERAWIAAGLGQEPEYFRFITYELGEFGSAGMGDAYRIYGEVISLYLDMLARTSEAGGIEPGRVAEIRRKLIEAAQG